MLLTQLFFLAVTVATVCCNALLFKDMIVASNVLEKWTAVLLFFALLALWPVTNVIAKINEKPLVFTHF